MYSHIIHEENQRSVNTQNSIGAAPINVKYALSQKQCILGNQDNEQCFLSGKFHCSCCSNSNILNLNEVEKCAALREALDITWFCGDLRYVNTSCQNSISTNEGGKIAPCL